MVERVLDHRDGHLDEVTGKPKPREYKVKWKGFANFHNSWHPDRELQSFLGDPEPELPFP